LEPVKGSPEEEARVKDLDFKLLAIYQKNTREKRIAFYEELCDFAGELKKKYPDYFDYRLYHVLIGSTPWAPCLKIDFPGDDSVEKFINSKMVGIEKKIKEL